MSVVEIIATTRAIQWWIDEQFAKGKTNEQVERELPIAAAFITGKLTMADLLAVR